jgi:hypothetical protein
MKKLLPATAKHEVEPGFEGFEAAWDHPAPEVLGVPYDLSRDSSR